MLHDTLYFVFDAPGRAAGAWQLVRVRAFAFAMVLAIGVLLLVTQIFQAALATNAAFAQPGTPAHAANPWWTVAGYGASFVLMTALFAALFHYVPDVEVKGRDAFVGGLVTAFLFLVGQWLLSVYLRHSAFSSIHGAAAAALIIFTRAYAFRRTQAALPLGEGEPSAAEHF